MTHSEMDELYELFVLGALERDQAFEIEQHLRDNCPYCQPKVQEAQALMAAFATVTDRVEPPKQLRDRVLSSIIPPAPKPNKNWLAGLLALGAACAAMIVFCILLANQVGTLRSQLGAAVRERDELQAALKVLSRSETRTVQFGRANQPQGRVFVNRTGGLVFVASRLPQLPNNRTFELWLVPPTGAAAARPAGLFQADANSDAVRVSSVQVDPANTVAVAVSVEPAGGSPRPTTTPIIVVPLS
ncbi:MAG: anti-sigma factor [Acidobacteriaceae bacterium]|nr:anti-sigma factor [Acidobacteriaceae bacterium]